MSDTLDSPPSVAGLRPAIHALRVAITNGQSTFTHFADLPDANIERIFAASALSAHQRLGLGAALQDFLGAIEALNIPGLSQASAMLTIVWQPDEMTLPTIELHYFGFCIMRMSDGIDLEDFDRMTRCLEERFIDMPDRRLTGARLALYKVKMSRRDQDPVFLSAATKAQAWHLRAILEAASERWQEPWPVYESRIRSVRMIR